LWFTESNTNNIGRITIAGVISEFPIPTAASGPFGIVSGPDSALWFTEEFGNKIGRITTAGVFTEYRLPPGNDLLLSPSDQMGRCGLPRAGSGG
jgi:virginiamycin B lyase